MLSSLRKWAACTLLLGASGLFAYVLYELGTMPAKAGPSGKDLFFLASGLVGALVALFGIATNRTWGRWFGMAIGVSGFSLVGITAFSGPMGLRWNLFALLALGGSTSLILLLAGPSMAQRLGSKGNPFTRGGGRRASLLGVAVVLSLAAVPTLWAWGCIGSAGQHLTRGMALAAAGLLGLGSLLIIWQRTAGLLALLVGGAIATALALMVLFADSDTQQRTIGWQIGVQWLLAAAGGIVAMIATARPVCRVLAGKPPVA